MSNQTNPEHDKDCFSRPHREGIHEVTGLCDCSARDIEPHLVCCACGKGPITIYSPLCWECTRQMEEIQRTGVNSGTGTASENRTRKETK